MSRRTAPALNARSLALSVMLGTHPPALPSRALVALAGLFGIAPGTMRTALSRLVADGTLTIDTAGWHQLTGALLARQRSQDDGRRDPDDSWDGRWHTVIAASDQRDLTERRHFRAAMGNHRLGELRPDIWMRPANAPVPAESAWIVVTGALAAGGVDDAALVAKLWHLPSIAARLDAANERLQHGLATLDWDAPDTIPTAFVEAAAVVRLLRREPRLPSTLVPPGWPAPTLRRTYDEYDERHVALLRTFLTSAAT